MDDNDQLAPSEVARDRRRDRDADAQARAGMKTGLAKQFKQVLDAQRRRAEEVERSPDEIGPAEPATGRRGRRRKKASG